MEINRTANTVRVTLTAEEAEAVRDDLGQIWASKISTAGDRLHSLLESVTDGEETHDVGDDSDDPEHVDDCPGCEATRPCGHDDYHDAHEWADRPGVWCPGHSVTVAAVAGCEQ